MLFNLQTIMKGSILFADVNYARYKLHTGTGVGIMRLLVLFLEPYLIVAISHKIVHFEDLQHGTLLQKYSNNKNP